MLGEAKHTQQIYCAAGFTSFNPSYSTKYGVLGIVLLKEYSGLNNKRIGKVFGVSLSAVTKAALRMSKQMKTQKKLKKETDQILYSIFKVRPYSSPC